MLNFGRRLYSGGTGDNDCHSSLLGEATADVDALPNTKIHYHNGFPRSN